MGYGFIGIGSIISAIIVRRLCYDKSERQLSDYVGVSVLSAIFATILYLVIK